MTARPAVVSSALRHWNSAFSRGVGYEAHVPGSFVETDRVHGYFIDMRAKTLSPSAAEPDKLLPTGLAQLALGWWERMLAGEDGAADRFLGLCALLENRAERRGEELRWRYDIGSRKYRVEPPQYSAMAQAQAASAFVRAYTITEEAHHADLARRAILPLLEVSSDLVVETAAGPILEESPSEPPSRILNGWIYGLWGLWDVHIALGDTRAREMLTASTDCLLATLPSYDIGWWTKYSLYPHRLPDLAKPFYHRLHVDQLEVMQRLTDVAEFGATASRWRGYDTAPHRVAVVAQKAVFVASGYA